MSSGETDTDTPNGETDTDTLDARGLLCPLPVIRTQERVADMAHGSELEVLATDPGTLHDVPAWCRVHGHELISTERNDREIIVKLRVVRPAISGDESLRD